MYLLKYLSGPGSQKSKTCAWENSKSKFWVFALCRITPFVFHQVWLSILPFSRNPPIEWLPHLLIEPVNAIKIVQKPLFFLSVHTAHLPWQWKAATAESCFACHCIDRCHVNTDSCAIEETGEMKINFSVMFISGYSGLILNHLNDVASIKQYHMREHAVVLKKKNKTKILTGVMQPYSQSRYR